MSINDSIGNSTIGSTAPAEGTAEPGVSEGVGIDQDSLRKFVSICSAGKQKWLGRLEQRQTASSWRRLAVAVLFFIITAIAGHTPRSRLR